MLRGLALLTAMLALVSAGCGDSGGDKFRDGYDSVRRNLDDLGDEVDNALQAAESKSDAQLAREFNGYADELADVKSNLAQLEPPADVVDDVKKLEGAIADVEQSLRDIARAAEAKDPRAARTATLALIQRGERLDDLEQQVQREAAG